MVIIFTKINKQIKNRNEGGNCPYINKVAKEELTEKWMFNKDELNKQVTQIQNHNIPERRERNSKPPEKEIQLCIESTRSLMQLERNKPEAK